ncbi:M16 family metallopeptidase [Rhodohalobacter sulfatireducens]|uniref:Insulinase family protein n=1 Tax=Rhodohalobacter sulfatireducens TaxID=2911366 RepID=A0ABS9KC03_9BACT|nr:pitrilysin family protein [Rhodohalobacter sulfatireducens]MCG2588363.1 insulinase family protein [Rhodohalobacter sulfatireducens]
MRKIGTKLLALFLVVALLPAIADSQDLESFEENVTEFTLDNGLKFIVVERPVAPVVSFVTHVDVGGANEPIGHTGMAHIFEHMAFKGTDYIGTTNWEEEKKVIEELDQVYQQWLQESYRPSPDSVRLEQLWTQFTELQEEAEQYVVNNEYSQIIDRNGGTGMNAGTGADLTIYYYSLPENRMELWFSLESDRFKNPVFREFYKEKEVVREERRSSVESQPLGRLIEEFLAVAYTAHPYGSPVIGWNSDITATTIEDAREFYNTYYVPSNITIAIAGDVDANEVREMAETYFGDLEEGPEAPPVYTKEPEQRGERRFSIQGQSQPILLMGYHTVAQDHPDAKALEILGSIISSGRTSRLYKRLVEDEQLALTVQAFNGYPGTKFETMFLTYALPNQGVEVDTLENAIHEEIQKVKNGELTQQELQRAKTNARANLVRSLDSNSGLAQAFAITDGQQGDWRKVFTDIEELNEVTLDDLQRVANTYFTEDNRTVGTIVNQDNEEVADAN